MNTSLKITSLRTLLLAVTGASGAVYARSLLKKASALPGTDTYVIFTENAKQVWKTETGEPWPGASEEKERAESRPGTPDEKEEGAAENFAPGKNRIHFINNSDFTFPYASGSNRLDCMIVLPCSMGSLGRIAAGMSADLIGRIADVQLKEKRSLLLIPREAPYNLIHLRNMTALCEAGAVIIPASPSFYHCPDSLETLVDSFADRLLEIAGLCPMERQFRWNP